MTFLKPILTYLKSNSNLNAPPLGGGGLTHHHNPPLGFLK